MVLPLFCLRAERSQEAASRAAAGSFRQKERETGTTMKKRHLLAAAGYLAIILFTVTAVLIGGRYYSLYLQNPYNSEKTSVILSKEGVLESTSVTHIGSYTRFAFKAVGKGACQVQAIIYDEENEKNLTMSRCEFTVLPMGVLYLTGYDYGGYQFTLLGMTMLVLYSFALSLTGFRRKKKAQFFSYKTTLYFALSVFFGLQSLMYLGLLGGTLIRPALFDSWRIYNLAGLIMMIIFTLSLPLLVVFAAFMSVSNLSLIRHEGFGRNNLFGILISIALFIGAVSCVFATIRNPNSTDIDPAYISSAVIRTIVSTAFVYFECILFSAMYCTQSAARHEPAYDKDFIIILGCKIGSDGKPLPLLRGRIDRAIAFYRRQLEETGKQARFIPSGGKGSDEVMSEAECMRDYLISQGIDENLIFPETQSTTTLENMRFSKKIADGQMENANILFSTTNYHVFRSGMFASKAGMQADGVGAKTKWYFWPNAQIREFIGMLASEWKINLMFVLTIVAVSTLFANIATIINWIIQ